MLPGNNSKGRIKRADAAGAIYHMLNRSNRRATIFVKDADYEAFERILRDAVAKFDVDFQLLCAANHGHLVVRPQVDGELSRFAQWRTLTHTPRYHAHHHSAGEGHIYQGRFTSFPV